MNDMYPEVLDTTNFRYLKVGPSYILTFIIYSYPQEISFMDFFNYFPDDMKMTISLNISKQSTSDVLKNISQSISKNEEEYSTVKKGNIAKDVLGKVKEDAKKIRYEIQINNQEIYKVYSFIRITSKDKEKIIAAGEILKSRMVTKMLKVNTLNFRHILGYLATCPFGYFPTKNLPNYFVNMTTNNIKTLFPFYTETIMNKSGILFGSVKNESKLCVIDLFDKSYLNHNMCIFGSSGGGKSYFTKLLILRNYLRNIKQYVIDPEGEYLSMPAQTIDIDKDYINIMEIFSHEISNNFFEAKINNVLEKIVHLCDLQDFKETIRKVIISVYNDYGINEDLNSIYIDEDMYLTKKVKESDKFPTTIDVIEKIKEESSLNKSQIKSVVNKLKCVFLGDFKFLSGHTSVNLNSDIIVFNISKVPAKSKSKVCEYLLEYIKEDIENYKKSLIYIDEIWKIIIENEETQSLVLDLYKTVRKKRAGIISITQDMSDFFKIDDGALGKSIFNNSYIKLFFKMDYNDFNILKNIGITSDEDYEKMITLVKGEVFMYFKNSNITLKVEANHLEKEIIEKGECM